MVCSIKVVSPVVEETVSRIAMTQPTPPTPQVSRSPYLFHPPYYSIGPGILRHYAFQPGRRVFGASQNDAVAEYSELQIPRHLHTSGNNDIDKLLRSLFVSPRRTQGVTPTRQTKNDRSNSCSSCHPIQRDRQEWRPAMASAGRDEVFPARYAHTYLSSTTVPYCVEDAPRIGKQS